MRSIKLVQIGSTIAIWVIVAYLLVMGCLILLDIIPGTMAELGQQVALFILFVGPEKVAAFFGPVLKRKQENG